VTTSIHIDVGNLHLVSGPRLIELAAQYADGFDTNAPVGTLDPEHYAGQARHFKQRVEAHGRDPEAFGFGVWFATFMHDEPEVLQRSPVLAWSRPRTPSPGLRGAGT